MYQNVEAINSIAHLKCGIKEIKSFLYAKELIHAPVTIAEFYEGCKDYPIVFVKDEQGVWTALALLGYKEKENLFIDEKGLWEKGRYIPAFIRRYPFIFMVQENTQELALAFDSACKDEVCTSMERKFFNEEGKATEFIQKTVQFLNQFQNDLKATSAFLQQLEVWELLEARMATFVTPSGEKTNVDGFYVVNEEKLRHLSEKKKNDICKKEAMPLITAHLISLSNVHRLATK